MKQWNAKLNENCAKFAPELDINDFFMLFFYKL